MRALTWSAGWLARSWHVEAEGDADVGRLRAAGIPLVFAVWHGHLVPPLWHRRGERITLLVSAHRDGGHLSEAAQRWGYRVLRGSSTRGGARALRQVVRALRAGGDAAFAADGPRGPRGIAKRGAWVAARLARARIIPVGIHASRAWRLGSWDRMEVPLPGARVRIVYGPALAPETVDDGAAAAVLARALDDAGHRARC